MNTDFPAEAKLIARELMNAGFVSEGQSLIDAVECASTGTELLMALRHNLDRVENSAPAIAIPIRDRLRTLRRSIDQALGQ